MKIFFSIILKNITIWLFFTSFFLFSHILYLFWIEQEINIFWISWFEWIKSIFVILFWILLFIYSLLFSNKLNENQLIWILLIFTGIVISSLLSISTWGFILWLSEKHHWWLYYLSLLSFFSAMFIWFKEKDYYNILNIIFLFFCILWGYAIIQKIWIDPLSEMYQTRVSLTRVFSTLWNANYLAWVSLMLLPLTVLIKNINIKYWLLIFSLLILILTGSYFWMTLAWFYILYHIYKYNKKIFLSSIIALCIIVIYIFNNLWIEKIWSMKARPYIWKSTISAIIESPKTLLLGYWPDTLQEVFHNYKAPELNEFETSTYTADRSHNIFIDLIYFFWLFWWWVIIYFLLYAIKIAKKKEIKLSLILSLLFFSFNIPVTIHFVIIILLLSGIYKKIW
jgi:hypothetical protein